MKQLSYLPCLAVLILFSSCYHVHYAPNTAHLPLLAKKGEVRATALFSTGFESEFTGGELQLAGAVHENFGLMVNGFVAGKSEHTGSYMESGKGSYVEGAVGFFGPMGRNSHWIAEAYLGLGSGSVKNDYGLGDKSKVGITKFFLQPAMGLRTKYVELAIAPKISQLYLAVKEDGILSGDNTGPKEELTFIRNKRSNLVFEPAFVLRAGSEDFKIQGALSFSAVGTRTFGMYDFYDIGESLNASIGVTINLAKGRSK